MRNVADQKLQRKSKYTFCVRFYFLKIPAAYKDKVEKQGTTRHVADHIYRVTLKSFLHYKHLLQEN